MYFPTMSFSRLTASPAFFFKSVVSSPVCGITDTEKFCFVTAATVRLIPSMQIEPFSTIRSRILSVHAIVTQTAFSSRLIDSI